MKAQVERLTMSTEQSLHEVGPAVIGSDWLRLPEAPNLQIVRPRPLRRPSSGLLRAAMVVPLCQRWVVKRPQETGPDG